LTTFFGSSTFSRFLFFGGKEEEGERKVWRRREGGRAPNTRVGEEEGKVG
jgi:hypothetical protein